MRKPQETFDKAVQFFPRDQILTAPILGIVRDQAKYESENTSNLNYIK